MDKYWTAISDYYQQNEPVINVLIFICSLILAVRYFFYLKGKEKIGSRIWAFFDVLTTWLPASDPVEEDKQARKDSEEERREFLNKRKARKPGNLTDEM
ncbi:hypothetical protein [Asticcacaulis machinosus]|uniref:Uncharacterized protein n=1 Tax=Asticcacaulis machinosus TaxID=2984211 RepID=A0ABT5HJJ3_9CAUL|nr:hypothetical protein [Asticcacaulis machinosus]MDC7676163.1 hypothetical protein [Asticcacaulis machinosus]